jgi:phage protein D
VDIKKLEQEYGDFFAPAFAVTVGSDDLVRGLFLTVASVKVDLQEKAAGRFSLTVTNAFNWEHREFVAYEDERRIDLLDLFAFGAQVEIKLGYGEAKKLKPVIRGTITEVSTSFTSGGAPALEIAGYDRLYPLTIGAVPDSWENKRDSEVVSVIAERHGLSNATVEKTSPVKQRIEKQEETDLSFLGKLAERNRSTFYIDADDKFYFGPRQRKHTADVTLPWGGGLVSFSPEASLNGQVAAVEVVGTAATTGEQVVGRAERSENEGRDSGEETGPERVANALSNQSVMRIRAGIHTQEEAQTRAEAILDERTQDFLKGSAECIGLPELRPDMNVALKGLGKNFSKTYWISGVVHEISGGGFTTSLSVQERSI